MAQRHMDKYMDVLSNDEPCQILQKYYTDVAHKNSRAEVVRQDGNDL